MAGQRKRQFGCLTYTLVAVVIYIIYMIVSAKPRPPSGPAMEAPVPGKLPVLDTDQLAGHRLETSKPSSLVPIEQEFVRPGSLSKDERAAVMDVIPTMERVVHLDLKGAAPKISYIEELFPFLKSLGATGLLIEWEDMFPYDKELEVIAAGDCYSKADVQKMLTLAKENSLEVIPLVQTFGHMEFVLKGEKYKSLREHPMQPQVINPHKPESLELIKEMIEQQLRLQPGVKRIHIGSDEVWDLGQSAESKEQMVKFGQTKDTIFLNHVREVAGYIKNGHPLLEVMMWDDEFRTLKATDIEKSGVHKLVTPVVWQYDPKVAQVLTPSLWQKYGKLFNTVWLASAFKGATGSDQLLTDISHHYDNHMGWLKILAKISQTTHVAGIMLTGWQRYDHFGTLCELLPVGIPSLAVCLSVMQHAGLPKENLDMVNKLLGCKPEAPIQWNLVKTNQSPPGCSFPGHKILEGAYELKNAQFFFNFLESKQALSAWHTDYNLKRRFVQRSRMNYLLQKCTEANNHLMLAENLMKQQLPKVFSEETVTEWMETNIAPLKKKIKVKMELAKSASEKDTWPRRPIHNHQP